MTSPLEQGWHRIIVVAGGNSFDAEQRAQVVQAQADGLCRVVVVNLTAFVLPTADAMYAADIGWWEKFGERVRNEFPGQRWAPVRGLMGGLTTRQRQTYPPIVKELGIREVVVDRGEGVPKDANAIGYGGNSGYQGISLAHRFGACCIVLAGFDFKHTGGRAHHHEDYPQLFHNAPEQALTNWIPRFTRLAADLDAAGVGVVNCSKETALTQFPRAPLSEVLDCFRDNPL